MKYDRFINNFKIISHISNHLCVSYFVVTTFHHHTFRLYYLFNDLYIYEYKTIIRFQSLMKITKRKKTTKKKHKQIVLSKSFCSFYSNNYDSLIYFNNHLSNIRIIYLLIHILMPKTKPWADRSPNDAVELVFDINSSCLPTVLFARPLLFGLLSLAKG